MNVCERPSAPWTWCAPGCIDVSGAQHCGVSTVAELVALARRELAAGRRLRLVRCGPSLRRTLRCAGLAHLFDFWRGNACCAGS